MPTCYFFCPSSTKGKSLNFFLSIFSLESLRTRPFLAYYWSFSWLKPLLLLFSLFLPKLLFFSLLPEECWVFTLLLFKNKFWLAPNPCLSFLVKTESNWLWIGGHLSIRLTSWLQWFSSYTLWDLSMKMLTFDKFFLRISWFSLLCSSSEVSASLYVFCRLNFVSRSSRAYIYACLLFSIWILSLFYIAFEFLKLFDVPLASFN